jgi:antitoxin component of MazEF toxin-antitoxin module
MMSKSRIKRWGNSYGVLLPKAAIEEEGLKEGEEVEVSVRKIKDIRALRGKYHFKDLQREKEEMKRGWE